MRSNFGDDVGKYVAEPGKFSNDIYKWGEEGTILYDHDGPDIWQAKVLARIAYCVARNLPVRIAVASGHGIGKSALVAWLIHWFMSTRGPNPQVVVTANTKNQLMTKTWRELARWHKLSINEKWFKWTATRYYGFKNPETWVANAIPWSSENSEAFAGTHEEHVLVIFDEASAVDDAIWEVTEGAMTTPGAMWVCFGNPTRNTGRFRECFAGGKFSHRWWTMQVDSRTAKMADKRQLNEWIEDYGIDSDFVKVRVLGQFPVAANNQFIPSDIVTRARELILPDADFIQEPKILSCDPARFGDDSTVVTRRQGGKVWQQAEYKGLDTMAVARIVANDIDEWSPDGVFVDGIGIGAGVVDRLREMHFKTFDVQVSNTANQEDEYFNHRAEIWGDGRKWLRRQVDLPADDDKLQTDLIGIEYGFDGKGRIQLEKKSDMKKRGLNSPDRGDSLFLGFSVPVRKDMLRDSGILAIRRETANWRVL